MINYILVCIGLLLYMGLYPFMLHLTIDLGIFETEYSLPQMGKMHVVSQVKPNEIRDNIEIYQERVFYKKKWYQRYRYNPLPDKWVFDSEKTKKMWEKINEN